MRMLIVKTICFVGLGIIILWLGEMGVLCCPFLLLTGIPCPSCGTTRAVLALLHGDIKKYIFYQPMALLLIGSVFLTICLDNIPIPQIRTLIRIIVFVILCVNFLFYLQRIG